MANETVNSMQDIEKLIEMEASYLMYMDRLDKTEAFEKAKEFVYNKHAEAISKMNGTVAA